MRWFHSVPGSILLAAGLLAWPVVAQEETEPRQPARGAAPRADAELPDDVSAANPGRSGSAPAAAARDAEGSDDRETSPARQTDPDRPDIERERRGSREDRRSNDAWLGVFLDRDDEDAQGARVTHVYPAGPAARAGFRPGDLIVSVNGEKVTSNEGLVDAVAELEPRSRATFEVRRNEDLVELSATLGSQNQFAFDGNQFDRSGRSRQEFDAFDNVPPWAMQLEHDRRMAEQHERMEKLLYELRDEVRQLREELKASRE